MQSYIVNPQFNRLTFNTIEYTTTLYYAHMITFFMHVHNWTLFYPWVWSTSISLIAGSEFAVDGSLDLDAIVPCTSMSPREVMHKIAEIHTIYYRESQETPKSSDGLQL